MNQHVKGGVFPVVPDEGSQTTMPAPAARPVTIPLVPMSTDGMTRQELEELYRAMVPFFNRLAKSLGKPGIRTQEDRR